MLDKLYLSDALGWDTPSRSVVALAQLREDNQIDRSKCPKAQLIKNCTYHWQPNMLKGAGYFPILNFFAGAIAIATAENKPELRPNNKEFWTLRGVAMILTGPLLFFVDLGKYLFDLPVVSAYHRAHPKLMEEFNPNHGHSTPPWTGHPVECLP